MLTLPTRTDTRGTQRHLASVPISVASKCCKIMHEIKLEHDEALNKSRTRETRIDRRAEADNQPDSTEQLADLQRCRWIYSA